MVHVTSVFKEEGNCVPVGYQYITCHMVFYVNMEFTINVSFVALLDKTDPMERSTCS